jgi:23S rRNA (cytosine1962-C5)-methyltransferase
MPLPTIQLRPLKPLRYGHPWIFATEIAKLPDTEIEDGSWVQLIDHNGKPYGCGYYNSKSKILVRRVTNADVAENAQAPSQDWWNSRIQAAYDYRVARGLVSRNLYRLIHAEGDGIPGLIVDVYGDYISVQILSLGIENQKSQILKALERTLHPVGIYDRSDVSVRKLEGLQEHTGSFYGDEPGDRLEIDSRDAKILVDIKHGGKTGLFLDQLENHFAAASEAKGREVLNVFSYTGLFGLRAAQAGAKSVEDVESSEYFQAIAADQWKLNKAFTSGCKYIQTTANAFDDLREKESKGYLCDMVILDPPAFTKNRAGADNAARGYNEINRRALKLLRPGGVLVTCSCTHHIDINEFNAIIEKAGRDAK